MNEKEIMCECGQLFAESKFKTHFKTCKPLIDKYTDFDFKMIQLIKTYLNSRENLIIIKFFLERYIKILNYKLKKIFDYKIPFFGKDLNKNKQQNNVKSFPVNNQELEKPNKDFKKTCDNIISQDSNNETEITFKIAYTKKGVRYNVRGQKNDKFQKVINDFIEKSKETFLKFMTDPIKDIKEIDPEKTLYELGIKNNDLIVFRNVKKSAKKDFKRNNNVKDFTNKNDGKIINENMNYDIGNNKYNNINNNVNNNNINYQYNKINSNTINNNLILKTKEPFMDSNSLKNFKKSNTPNIINLPNKNQDILLKNKVREKHIHELVFCFTNFDWTCMGCKKKSYKNDPKYFCSQCGFSICSNCKNKNNKDK